MEQEKFCMQCGKKISSKYDFCEDCIKKFESFFNEHLIDSDTIQEDYKPIIEFDVPQDGWVNIIIGDNNLKCASYLRNALSETLFGCINYLKKPFDERDSFSITYDSENQGEFGIVKLSDGFYLWEDSDEGVPTLKELSLFDDNFVNKLARDTIISVNGYLEDWVRFESQYDDNLYDKTRQNLLDLIGELKQLLFEESEKSDDSSEQLSIWSKYHIPRGEWQDYFCKFLEDCGFDGVYGFVEDDLLKKYLVKFTGTDTEEETEFFDNGTFRIVPYWWGDSDEIASLPNFVYYPTGFEMNWYKYPLRDTWSNIPITFDEFKDMIDKCEKSLKDEYTRS